MPTVVVIGAGATGLGIGWDLALRGCQVTVLDQGDVAHGTSGRFHGLLHSGARYVLSDPIAARQCQEENQILRRVASRFIEDTGGIFVASPNVSDHYVHQWQSACRDMGIEVSVGNPVPGLHPQWQRIYSVNDGVLHGFGLLQGLARGIEDHQGTVLTHHQVVAVQSHAEQWLVAVQGSDGAIKQLVADAVVNAAGPWAGQVAELWNEPLPLTLSKGIMIVFAHRHTSKVVNRLDIPGDGDILVPHQDISMWGTTDQTIDKPQDITVDADQVQQLIERGKEMFPQMDTWRPLRAFAGIRPLYQTERQRGAPTREITRDFIVYAHQQEGLYSVVGGKWTTFRLMAEKAADQVASALFMSTSSRTHITQIPQPPAPPLEDKTVDLCECERVSVHHLESFPGLELNDIRTRTWFGMGPCQGTFCGHRLANWRASHIGVDHSMQELRDFRRERLRGMSFALWGDNAVEWMLQHHVRRQTLGEEGPYE